MTSRALLAACGLVLLGAAGPARRERIMTSTLLQSDTTRSDAIRPFHVKVPEAALVDLRRRINATRWPDKETVPDQSQVPSWPGCRRWCSTGAAATTGVRRRRS